MIYFYLFTFLCLVVSFIKDRDKTYRGLNIAWKKFKVIFPSFLSMLILISIFLFLVPNEMIGKYLGGAGQIKGVIAAMLFGSITIMPGFVAFPLCGILLQKGVSYMVLAAFSTSLMLVGILTYPVEKAYFGSKVTIIRNILCFFLSFLIAVLMGIVYKELFI